jgi:taurine dioxygenase
MDMSYEAAPPAGSILYAAEIPPAGGDTGFINLYRAYETLPGFLKQAIHRRVCTHDSSHNSVGQQRSGFEPVTDPRQTPGAAHPLVQRHPITGKTVLYLGRRRNAYIHGLPLDESEDLLDELWSHATAAQNVWYQQWQVGDVLLWDNYATVHRRNGFDPTSRRLLLRTQIASQGPEAA